VNSIHTLGIICTWVSHLPFADIRVFLCKADLGEGKPGEGFPAPFQSLTMAVNSMLREEAPTVFNVRSPGRIAVERCIYLFIHIQWGMDKEIKAAQRKREVGFCEFMAGPRKRRWIRKEEDRESSLLCHTLKKCDSPC
jgi:hypothetical protein